MLIVRWYCRYSLSYRDLQEMMAERKTEVAYTTLFRRVQDYAPDLDKRVRPHLLVMNDSWRVNETYCKIKRMWRYLYRAVDSGGKTLDFMLSAKRASKAAKCLFEKVLRGSPVTIPCMVNIDINTAYPPAVDGLINAQTLPEQTKLRQINYLNNLIEQDYHFVKRCINLGLGFGSFNTACRIIWGYEAMNMI